MTLPERPGLLHAVPLLDLFAILWLLFLLGPSLLQRSGVMVELPPSRFQLERYRETFVVTLGPGESQPRIHFGRESILISELDEKLEQLRKDGACSKSMVLLQTDFGTPAGTERQISELILSKGFRLALVGTKEAPPTSHTRPHTLPSETPTEKK